MEETLKELIALVDKYRDNKYRLNNEDTETARGMLRSLFLNTSYMKEACKQITCLPENCCRAFLDAWESSDDVYRELLVGTLLDEPAMLGKTGNQRMIKLIADFIQVDSRTALNLVTDLSKRVTGDGSQLPQPRLAKNFWKELIVTKKLFNISLEDPEIPKDKITALALTGLSGILKNPLGDGTIAYEFFKWLEQAPGKIFPGSKLKKEITNVTKSLPVNLQRQCYKLGLSEMEIHYEKKKGTDPEYPEISFPSRHTPSFSVNKYSPVENLPPSIEDNLPVSPLLAGFAPVYDYRSHLDWLGRHIASLEKKNLIVEEENITLANVLRLREIEYAQSRKCNVKLEQLVVRLRKIQEQTETTMQEKIKLISFFEKEKKELEETLLQEKNARKKEVEGLKNRIERERNYVREEFKNILADKLFLHYRGYCEAKIKTPSEQLANHLIYLLQRIFRELINLGIELDGDSNGFRD